MIKTNFPDKFKVRCLRCGANTTLLSDLITHAQFDGIERAMGYEIEHIFQLNSTCKDCNCSHLIEYTVFEYPEGVVNIVNPISRGVRFDINWKEFFQDNPT